MAVLPPDTPLETIRDELRDALDALQNLIQAQDRAAWSSAIIAALGAILGAVLGAALAVGVPYFIAWRNRPRLHLSFNKDVDLFDFYFTDGEGSRRTCVYTTVQLKNVGKSVAKNVRVYLSALEKVYQNGDSDDVPLGTSFLLAWPGWTFEGRELPKGVSFAVEVVSVDKSKSGWIFQFKGAERNQDKVRSYKGMYRFTIVAVADNAEPVTYKLSVSYHGDWHQFEPTGLQS